MKADRLCFRSAIVQVIGQLQPPIALPYRKSPDTIKWDIGSGPELLWTLWGTDTSKLISFVLLRGMGYACFTEVS
jgi:hypothetical protein